MGCESFQNDDSKKSGASAINERLQVDIEEEMTYGPIPIRRHPVIPASALESIFESVQIPPVPRKESPSEVDLSIQIHVEIDEIYEE